MKMTITKKELNKFIIGKFIIQIDNSNQDFELSGDKKELEFYLEKRIGFVGSSNILKETKDNQFESKLHIGVFHPIDGFCLHMKNEDDFLEFFNNYTDGSRYHRLLTSKELDILNKWLKENNY